MTTPVTADNIRSLWQRMPTDTVVITADEMRTRARKFQGRIRVRNSVEYVAFAIVFVSFGHIAWIAETWQAKAAAILIVLGGTLAVWNLHRRGRAIATPASASATALVEFQRAELTRQRNVMLTAWRWYFLPLYPGFIFFMIIGWMGYLRNGVPTERLHQNIIITGVLMVVITVIGVLLQFLGAAHLQRRIEDLDRYKEKT